MNPPFLSVEHVTVAARQRGNPAQFLLQDVTFSAFPGELFVVAGPSGSGKSTLLRVIAGMLSPEAGRLQIGKPLRPVNEYTARDKARLMAVLPQQFVADNPFRVDQTVLFGRAPWQPFSGRCCTQDKDVALHAMKLMGVDFLAGCRFAALSGGEKQRVLLARALCQTPRILLLDEPTSAQDYGQQARIMDTLTLLCTTQKLTVVMATHDLNLAAMYAHQILLLDQGCSVALGTPRDVLNSAMLESVYHCPFIVDQHPCMPTPRITFSPVFPLQHEKQAGQDW